MRIRKISNYPYEGKVYNIGVNTIHNYYCQGMLITNCYTSAVKAGNNYPNVVEKFKRFFEPLNEHRPYQIACLEKDELVATSHGLIPIKNLKIGARNSRRENDK